ncbi:MAG: MFS transporter [Deltaproteobacteria bacterium]|nr:MFS transporter [Deltaproteobacteria bacterium]
MDTSSTNQSSSNKPGSAGTGLGVIFLTVFVDLVGFSIIFPLFPQLLDHYLALEGDASFIGGIVSMLDAATGGGPGARTYTIVLFGGLLGSLYSVLQFFSAPLWGRLSDRHGRRRILQITSLGVAISYAVWFFSGNFMLLVLSRLIGGAMSGNISVATAAVADVTSSENRSKGMGMLGAAFGLGFLLGPAVGGGLATLFNPLIDTSVVDLSGIPGINPFSMAALGAFIMASINFVWIFLRFKETLPEGGSTASSQRPINPLAFLKKVPFAGVNRINAVYFIYLFAFTGMEFTLTFLARERFQYTAGQNVYLFIFIGFIIATVQGGIVRRVTPKYGEKKIILFGMFLLIPGMSILGAATTEFAMYLGLGILAVGSALATPTLTALVSLYTPSDRQGEILGTFRSLGALARAVGPIVACGVYWRFGSGWPYFGAAIITLLPLAIALGLPAPEPPEKAPEE